MVTVKFYMSELGRTCNGAAIPVTALLSVSFKIPPFCWDLDIFVYYHVFVPVQILDIFICS